MPRIAALAPFCVALLAGPVASAQTKEECAKAANDAQTARDSGKYLVARRELVTCANVACPAIVGQACRQWLTQLDADMPTVVLSAKDDLGRDRADVQVSMNGQVLVTRLSGTPTPADPGEHAFRFEATGAAPAEERVVLHAGEKGRVVAVVLPGLVGTTPAPSEPVHEGMTPAVSPHVSIRATLALVFAGLALGAAGTGVYFAVQSTSASSSAAPLRAQTEPPSGCVNNASPKCGQLGDFVHTQYQDANVSKALFVATGALAVAAVVTWLVWPTGTSGRTSGFLAPAVGPTSAALLAGWRLP